MATRNLCFTITLLACVALYFQGCRDATSQSRQGAMSRADSLLLNVLPKDTLLARVEAKKAAIPADSLKAGHWVVRLDDPAELEAIRVHFAENMFNRQYVGSWARQQACYRRDLRSDTGTVRREAMGMLANRLLFSADTVDAELLGLVYREMYDQYNDMVAMLSASYIDPDHAADSIIHLLQTADLESTVFHFGFDCLGNTRPSLKTISFLQEQLGKAQAAQGLEEQYLIKAAVRGLMGLHEKANTSEQHQIEQILLDHHARRPLGESEIWRLVRQMSVGQPLPGHLPFVEAHVHDSIARKYAVLCIAKIRSAGAQALVTELFHEGGAIHEVSEAIPYAWQEHPKGALPLLLQGYQDSNGRNDGQFWLEAVWKTGGKPLADAFVAGLRNPETRNEAQKYFHLLCEPLAPLHPLRLQASKLLEAGLIDAPLPDSLLYAVQAQLRENNVTDLAEALLDYLLMQTWVEEPTEIRFIDHLTQLVRYEFGYGAKHTLDGLECFVGRESISQGAKSDLLWLIFHGKAYFVDLPPLTFAQKVEAVRGVLHHVLADAGVQERFMPFPSAVAGAKDSFS